jgi:glucose dehydrogenase
LLALAYRRLFARYVQGGKPMQRFLRTASICALLAGVAAPASANEELLKKQQDPKQTGDYSNHRFSKLKQITAENAHKLAPAWTFSTGVLRGHEGGPLVIEDIMSLASGQKSNSIKGLSSAKESGL